MLLENNKAQTVGSSTDYGIDERTYREEIKNVYMVEEKEWQ